MGRLRGTIIPGAPHLATQSAPPDQGFWLDLNASEWTRLLRHSSAAEKVRVVGYCAASGALQAILIPPTPKALKRMFQRMPGEYQCNALELDALLEVVRAVERGPVRGGLVERACDYPWSSAASHVLGVDLRGLLDMPWWWATATGLRWQEVLEGEPEVAPALAEIA